MCAYDKVHVCPELQYLDNSSPASSAALRDLQAYKVITQPQPEACGHHLQMTTGIVHHLSMTAHDCRHQFGFWRRFAILSYRPYCLGSVASTAQSFADTNVKGQMLCMYIAILHMHGWAGCPISMAKTGKWSGLQSCQLSTNAERQGLRCYIERI